MSILTEKEIVHIAGAESRNVMEFARAIESAVLAKLAGMELPWGDDIEAWLEVRTGAEIAAAFHQAFAKGAASQLSAEPVAYGWKGVDGSIRDCIAPDTHAVIEGQYDVPLYTLKTKQ